MSERYKFHDGNGVYFITTTVVNWIDTFTKKQYCEIILDSLQYCQQHKGLVIHAWCIMTNHLHLIVSSVDQDLAAIIRDFKKFTSKSIIHELLQGNDPRKEWILWMFSKKADEIKRNKSYKVWQDGNHPILLDTNKMIDQRLDYLHNNPVKQGIVANSYDYLYSSAGDYAGNKGLLRLELIE